jgi:hypothetical protein
VAHKSDGLPRWEKDGQGGWPGFSRTLHAHFCFAHGDNTTLAMEAIPVSPADLGADQGSSFGVSVAAGLRL